jgi:hypothetical protein
MVTITLVSGRSSLTIARRNVMPKGPAGNVLHVAAFACLGYSLARAFDAAGAGAGLATSAGRSALLVAAAFGLSDEIHQFFTPGRLCSLYDALLDAAGAAFALLVPRPSGPGRPASFAPSSILLAAAVVVAVVTGEWRAPGDAAIESSLRALGF